MVSGQPNIQAKAVAKGMVSLLVCLISRSSVQAAHSATKALTQLTHGSWPIQQEAVRMGACHVIASLDSSIVQDREFSLAAVALSDTLMGGSTGSGIATASTAWQAAFLGSGMRLFLERLVKHSIYFAVVEAAASALASWAKHRSIACGERSWQRGFVWCDARAARSRFTGTVAETSAASATALRPPSSRSWKYGVSS
jgi:hypothetical protein